MSTISLSRSSTTNAAALRATCATRLERSLLGVADGITALVSHRMERRAAAHRAAGARVVAEEQRRDRAATAHDGLLPR